MAGETILIVEDSPISLRLTASALRAQGYRVEVASTAEQAWSSLRSLKPDLILVDIVLPGMNGLELTRLIKQDSRLREVMVVALTASDVESGEEQAHNAGCDGYLTKPLDEQTLAEIRHYLDFGGDVFAHPARAGDTSLRQRRETTQQPIALAIPEAELEDIKRTFLRDGVVQSRQLLASLDQGFDERETALLSHRWAGAGGLLGYPRISDRARDVELMLLTPPWTPARMRVALTKLTREFVEPAAAVAEMHIPDSIAKELEGTRVALVGLADVEADHLCSALEKVGAKPRLFGINDPPENVGECNVALVHVRAETMEAKWLTPAFVPPPGIRLVLIGARERLLGLDPAVQARAREFLIDGWQPEEALMRLSFALSREAEPDQAAAPVSAAARAPEGPPVILVADDDITVRALVRSTLQNFGMQCRMAASGPETLDEVRTHRPHAVVLDVNMPGMDGFEVLAAIRAENIPVRVLLLTARQQDRDVLMGFSLGADDYVVKPFNPMELVARLKRLLAAN